jgi:sugar phosphate permease
VLVFNSAALIYLWGLNAWLPTYLPQVRHFNVRDVGIFASLPFILMFAGEVGAAALSDWLGRRAVICFVGLFGAGLFVYFTSLVSNAYLAAVLIAISAGCWGAALPTLFALALEIIPSSVTAAGVGVYNGVGNLIGACSPLAMGWIIGKAHSFNAGLLVMVFAGVLGACSMLPLMKRH